MRLRIQGRLVARNTALNAVGIGLPLLLALWTMPVVARGLGPEGFGFLGIAWMLLGYFGELGFGRATTKFVAELLGDGDATRVAGISWATVAVQTGFGLLGGLILAAGTPLLAEQVLKIPPALQAEARIGLLILAATVPVMLVGGSFRAVLEAAQRFDLVNAVRIPSSALNYVLPLVGLLAGLRLSGILALMLAARAVAGVAFYLLALRVVPALRGWPQLRGIEWRGLFAFGGWITVSGIVSPLLVYVDRFLLGALAAMSAVAYYTAPYELVTRLWVLPASLVSTLFPAFSTLAYQREWDQLEGLFARSVKYVLVSVGPMAVLVVTLAGDVLGVWLGPDYAREGTVALQVLAVGVLVNALAFLPQALVQGLGRADLTAKFHLLELPVHVVVGWVLVGAWGVPGAALAWSLRVTLDAVLLFWAADRLAPRSTAALRRARVPRSAALLAGFGVLSLLVTRWSDAAWQRGLMGTIMLATLAALLWRVGLVEGDRNAIRRFVRAAGN